MNRCTRFCRPLPNHSATSPLVNLKLPKFECKHKFKTRRIENAIELAKLYGILKYLPDGQLTHAPFSISPYKISAADLQEMTELTAPFSELMISISQNWEFLEHHLEPIAKIDPFLRMLMDCRTDEITQSKQLLVQRNDFFLIKDESQKNRADR